DRSGEDFLLSGDQEVLELARRLIDISRWDIQPDGLPRKSHIMLINRDAHVFVTCALRNADPGECGYMALAFSIRLRTKLEAGLRAGQLAGGILPGGGDLPLSIRPRVPTAPAT